MSSSVDVPKTFGALLIGAFFASLLSGTVVLQTILYFKLYPNDSRRIKLLVLAVWLLDTCHTSFIWVSVWDYMIIRFGNADGIDNIPWSLPLTIVFTAVLTMLVHCFFAVRIFRLSKNNYLLTAPILVLAVLRLASASVTTGEMIRLDKFSTFKENFTWIFTMGLALSSSVDILITGSLFLLLEMSRTGGQRLNAIIDEIILYTFETGSLTCAATIVSMICWIVMSHNLIFMGLHFVIGKLYATSLLVSLNTRTTIRKDGSQAGVMVETRNLPTDRETDPKLTEKLQISVERSVSYTVETRHFPSYDYGQTYADCDNMSRASSSGTAALGNMSQLYTIHSR